MCVLCAHVSADSNDVGTSSRYVFVKTIIKLKEYFDETVSEFQYIISRDMRLVSEVQFSYFERSTCCLSNSFWLLDTNLSDGTS